MSCLYNAVDQAMGQRFVLLVNGLRDSLARFSSISIQS